MVEQMLTILQSGTQIRDDDHQEDMVITDEMIARSSHAKQKIQQSLFAIAEGLAEIRDYRLYLVDNCPSFTAWLERYAGMSRRNAFNYLKVVEKYATHDGVVQTSALMERIGVSKLLEAAKLPKDRFERFKRTGEIETSDDKILTPDQIEQLDVRTFRTYIQQIRGKDGTSPRVLSSERQEHHQAIKSLLHSITKQLSYVEDDELRQYEQELQALEHRIAQHLGGERGK